MHYISCVLLNTEHWTIFSCFFAYLGSICMYFLWLIQLLLPNETYVVRWLVIMHSKSLKFALSCDVSMQPFSRRTNRLACRRVHKTSTFGVTNAAFLLEDMPQPSSACRRSLGTETDEDAACTLDRRDADDDRRSVSSCPSVVALSKAAGHGPINYAEVDRDVTTCVVIERPASTSELDADNEQLITEVDGQTDQLDDNRQSISPSPPNWLPHLHHLLDITLAAPPPARLHLCIPCRAAGWA